MADELNLPRIVETQLQLGLLAAQVALAERLPVLAETSQEPPQCLIDRARLERFVRALSPNARRAVRLLCDEEGGSATPARLMELTGAKNMGGMTASVRKATHRAFPQVIGRPDLLRTIRSDETQPTVERYEIAPAILLQLREALTRIPANG